MEHYITLNNQLFDQAGKGAKDKVFLKVNVETNEYAFVNTFHNKIKECKLNGLQLEEDESLNIYDKISNLENQIKELKTKTPSFVDSLLFKIPNLNIDPNLICHFFIEFSDTDDFKVIKKTIDTQNIDSANINPDNTIKNIKLFNGLEMTIVNMNNGGIPPVYSEEQLILKIDPSFNNHPFFRFCWIIICDNIVTRGRYGFGSISSVQSIFDRN